MSFLCSSSLPAHRTTGACSRRSRAATRLPVPDKRTLCLARPPRHPIPPQARGSMVEILPPLSSPAPPYLLSLASTSPRAHRLSQALDRAVGLAIHLLAAIVVATSSIPVALLALLWLAAALLARRWYAACGVGTGRQQWRWRCFVSPYQIGCMGCSATPTAARTSIALVDHGLLPSESFSLTPEVVSPPSI